MIAYENCFTNDLAYYCENFYFRMKKQQNIYGEMKTELQRRQEVEREARERARQMRANSQDRTRELPDEKAEASKVSHLFDLFNTLGRKFFFQLTIQQINRACVCVCVREREREREMM